MQINKRITRNMSLTAIAAAVSLLAACGGGGSDSSPAAAPGTPLSIQGTVSDSIFTPGSATEPTMAATVYQNALVCVDANSNGVCDTNEVSTRTDSAGKFALKILSTDTVIADIGTDAKNGAGTPVAKRNVFRVSPQQLNEKPTAVAISPLSAEVMRMMEADGTDYAATKAHLATRLNVSATDVVGDVNTATGATKTALLNEANQLSERYAYAVHKLDHHDLYPDALAVPGGDPRLTGTADTRPQITFKQSQQAAFNIEGVPRYDHIFIVMLENKATKSIKGSNYAPNINQLLGEGNQLTSYFATGNPSEPNYTALGGADDFGIADDNAWNCDATGANQVVDPTLPANAKDGTVVFVPTCTKGKANHNIVGKPNMFHALTAAGLTWRTYSESMNPGQDVRADSIADPAVIAKDHAYPAGSIAGVTVAQGDATMDVPMPAGLYKTKHHPGMAYQDVRISQEFNFSNRTLGGGQWDAALKTAAAAGATRYTVPAGYDFDQFSTDLASGDIGSVNFVVPDQCDDMHGGVGAAGTVGGVSTPASDCSSTSGNAPQKNDTGNNIIFRSDKYVKSLVDKIRQSAIWNNSQKRVAIVLMFDEGNSTFAAGNLNSCCGWNPGTSPVAVALNADGTKVAPVIDQYSSGNRGHGESIFGILTNQPDAPKGISDNDAYSHFSFVRTLQDMFALADPANDSTYMNRSKYTEQYIAAHLGALQEYAGSADTHFDSVRPINHAFVPAGYVGPQSDDMTGVVATDTPGNVSVWAVKK